VDLSRLLQMLPQKRGGQSGLHSNSLSRALKQLFGQSSRTRRNAGVQTLDRPESLEVRQVLSAVAVVAHSAPLFSFEESTVGDSFGWQDRGLSHNQASLIHTDAVSPKLVPDHSVIQLVREQLSKSLAPWPSDSLSGLEMSSSEAITGASVTGDSSRVQPEGVDLNDGLLISGLEDSGLEFSEAEMVGDRMWDPSWLENSEQLNVRFVIEFTAGPQEVFVETISSTNLQIVVSGLAGTVYESSGVEFTAQVLYENAVEVLQRVQPSRPVQILFPVSSISGRDRLPTIPDASVDRKGPTFRDSEASPSVADNQTSPDIQGPLSGSLVPDGTSKVISDESSIDSSLIDQVFAVSDLVLDASILVTSGVSKFQQTPAWPQADSQSALLLQLEEMQARAAEIRQEPESVASTLVISNSQGGLVRLARRGLSWLRSGRFPVSLVSDAVVSEFLAGVAAELKVQPKTELTSSNVPVQSVEWLSWLLRTSSATNQQLGVGTENSVHRGELTPGPTPSFGDQGGYSRDVRAGYSPQAQIRKYREQHRHASGLNGAISVALSEHESSTVPQSTSIPRELKYVANPRGPPVYGRDADVPLLEVDAPADLLERLRYSIAPRGPSLATVETQSPDFTFSSGPRMSPEKVSTELAL
jgi:hypothetical protein